MGKTLLLQTLIFIICLISLKTPVMAGEAVDFGRVTASQFIVVARNMMVTIPVSCGGVMIESSYGLINSQNHDKIPRERMTLLWSNKTIPLDEPQVFIDFKGLSQTAPVNLKLNLELRPIDRPGCYTGEILLRYWKLNPESPDRKQWLSESPVSIPVKVSIEAWVNLQSDIPLLKLESIIFHGNRDLQSSEPLNLKVASNTDWIIYLDLYGTAEGNLPLAIKTSGGQARGYRGIEQMGIGLFQSRKPVAAGAPTVNEMQYWCKVPVNISVNDFAKCPAGIYKFKLHFSGEIYDAKSAVNF
jgi:hypothetical protein